MKALLGVVLFAAMTQSAMATEPSKPIVITKGDVAGGAFKRPSAKVVDEGSGKAHDYLTLLTKDKKFETGMYKAGASHFEFKGDKTYGVDEFMYFIKGSITLTSTDGTVQVIHAGEAVTIPHDWQGTWEPRATPSSTQSTRPKGMPTDLASRHDGARGKPGT